MDSPGHSTQYCTYTFMENDTKKIVMCQTNRQADDQQKSTNLENAVFNALTETKDHTKVVEVVTDVHLQRSAFMSMCIYLLSIY